MVLVDSSAWIEGIRKNGAIEVKYTLDGLLNAYEAQWCSPVRLEVLGGARLDERKHLAYYFSVIPYRPNHEDDWERAVSLAWRIRENGLTVPWLDILIASIAIHDQVRLYTTDKHFEKISQFTPLMLYKPGYGGSFSEGKGA
ncbi:MAG: PIN domain-containing protein [Akkermansiaceae bacterium]